MFVYCSPLQLLLIPDAKHIYSIPSFQLLRVYHAHSASVTALSISPNRVLDRDAVAEASPDARAPNAGANTPTGQGGRRASLPPVRSNQIHVASCSIDGNVCIASLVDKKDVQVRNFGRPLQAVALSPQYRADRTYLSGGLAGKLMLTVGGKPGTSSSSNAAGTSTLGSGWLGTLTLGSQDAKEVLLHSGEGAISTIKWSWTGRYVVWVNEKGIKIMRSNIGLDGGDSDMAWKRIGHVDRPKGAVWEEMSAVWKSRVEWIDEESLDSEDFHGHDSKRSVSGAPSMKSGLQKPPQDGNRVKHVEKVVVGWGGTVWIIHLHPGRTGLGREVGERFQARAEIITM